MLKETNTDLRELALSGIRRFTALANQTPGCIKLTLGEPEFDTPAPICAKVTESLAAGKTHYPPNDGALELREALSAYMADQGLTYAADEILVTVGATEALASTINALINPGDEVIIPEPAFGLYETLVRSAHGRVVALDTTGSDFQITPEALSAAVTSATKAIVLTSPNNPTGCVYSSETLAAVAEAAREHGFYVICDDVYNRLAYMPYERFALAYPGLRDQVVVVDSFSKPWAMTGWRLGWLAAAPELKAQIAKMHQYLVSCVPAFTQDAAVVALSTPIDTMCDTYAARRSLVVERLRAMGLPCVEPKGAFYAFPCIKGLGVSSDEFCERAIKESGVALVPGSCFGAEGYARLSYCVSDTDLQEGLARLAAFVQTLRTE